MKKKKPIIILYGPTGVGKSDCALELGNRLNGEIINMDMGALYTPLTIGTAKPDWKKYAIPHHLFDVINTPRNLTVVEYRALLLPLVDDIFARGKTPILVGGSGFYLKSLFFPPSGVTTQESSEYARIPDKELWNHLRMIDADRANSINPNDLYRIRRALDIWYTTGIAPSQYEPKFEPVAPFALFFLTREREKLYARIDQRVKDMLDTGWKTEVKQLMNSPWEQFIHEKKIIGYDDILNYFGTKQTITDKKILVEKIQTKTRNYAKRQFTFWRSLQKDLQDALSGYTDSNLAGSFISEIDVAHGDCVTKIENSLKKSWPCGV